MPSALKGIIGVLLIELGFYLIPESHDPAFISLPIPLRLFIILALLGTIVSGFFFISWGIADHFTKRHLGIRDNRTF